MMKNFFLMLWVGILAIVISGCASNSITLTDGVGKRIALDVDILDEYETYHGPWVALPWRGKAELYLKVYDKKNPEVYLLYPLNVETNVSGTTKTSLITPFKYGTPTVLVFELLDDDSWSEEEAKLLVEAARTGALIVCDTATAYKSDYIAATEVIFKNKDRIVSLAESGATVLVQNINKHKFDSIGSCEYPIVYKGGLFIKTPVTILRKNDPTKAHCNIYVYAIE